MRDDTGLETGVERDLLERSRDGDANDVRTGRLVALELELVERDGRSLRESDATKVTRSALQNAASIAALFLTTEAVIADKPEKNPPQMGGDPSGGMDF